MKIYKLIIFHQALQLLQLFLIHPFPSCAVEWAPSLFCSRVYVKGKANLTPEEVVSVAPRQVLNFYGILELP